MMEQEKVGGPDGQAAVAGFACLGIAPQTEKRAGEPMLGPERPRVKSRRLPIMLDSRLPAPEAVYLDPCYPRKEVHVSRRPALRLDELLQRADWVFEDQPLVD